MAQRTRHPTLLILLALVALASTVSAQNNNAQSGTSWLDRPLTVWNKPGTSVPSPAQKPAQPATIVKRCSLTSPTPATGASALATAGWIPYLHQDRAVSRDGVDIIGGLTDAGAACEPTGFNLFVFVNGRFAGTLSPVPMTTSRDGVAGAVRLVSANGLTTEFARFAPGDLDCCPSTRVRVTYRIDRGDQPTIVATGVQVLR